MTREAAERAVKRAYGADVDNRIESITIITREWPGVCSEASMIRESEIVQQAVPV